MVLVVRPNRITNHRAAVVSVYNAQSVNRGVDVVQFGINRGDCLCPRQIVNINFKKSTERNINRPPSVRLLRAEAYLSSSRLNWNLSLRYGF